MVSVTRWSGWEVSSGRRLHVFGVPERDFVRTHHETDTGVFTLSLAHTRACPKPEKTFPAALATPTTHVTIVANTDNDTTGNTLKTKK